MIFRQLNGSMMLRHRGQASPARPALDQSGEYGYDPNHNHARYCVRLTSRVKNGFTGCFDGFSLNTKPGP
jgi:hypothetical protein